MHGGTDTGCTQRVGTAPVGGPTDTADVTGRRRNNRRGDGLAKERARRAAGAANQPTKPRPLKVVIATTPHSGSDGPSLQRDITLVKAALLYADEVELVSPGAAMLGSMAFVAARGEAGLLEVLEALDDSTLRQIGGRDLPENWRQLMPALELLSNVDPAQLLAVPGLEELAEQVATFGTGMRSAAADFSDKTEEVLAEAGAGELVPAIDAGVLTLSRAGLAADISGAGDMLGNFLDIVKTHLADPRSRLMFDDDLAGLVRAMIREGMVEPHHLAIAHAGQAAVGSGLVTRLPAFIEPPMAELLDLRRDLHAPLTNYRAAVVKMADRLTSKAYEPENAAELDDLWISDVEPALVRMREELSQHGLVRELAREAVVGPDVVVRAATGPGTYIGLDAVSALSGWAAAAAGAAAGAAALGQMAARAAQRGREARAKTEQHDLFYLFELDRRL